MSCHRHSPGCPYTAQPRNTSHRLIPAAQLTWLTAQAVHRNQVVVWAFHWGDGFLGRDGRHVCRGQAGQACIKLFLAKPAHPSGFHSRLQGLRAHLGHIQSCHRLALGRPGIQCRLKVGKYRQGRRCCPCRRCRCRPPAQSRANSLQAAWQDGISDVGSTVTVRGDTVRHSALFNVDQRRGFCRQLDLLAIRSRDVRHALS